MSASKFLQKAANPKENITHCEICEKENNDLFNCERCDKLMCSDCQTQFNQFTQIDYNCCKYCAENSRE